MALGMVIPAFNEAEKIGAVLDAVPATVRGHAVSVLVVDDGSSDGTAQVARGAGATVFVQPENRGKGAALRRGMAEARSLGFDVLVWMDSDGQHRPEDLPTLTAPVVRGAADMVVGSRYLGTSDSSAPLNRRLVRKSVIRAIQLTSGISLTDPFSGYRAFSPAAVDVLDLCGDGYESELEATFCVARNGLHIVEVPIDRIYGPNTSKMGYHHGRLVGRVTVVTGYARTIGRAWLTKDDRIETTVG